MRRKKLTRTLPRPTINVAIEQNGLETIQALARNISLEGMLLEPESSTQQPGTKVHLACRLNDLSWQIEATVMHANSTGLGVKFLQPQPSLVKAAIACLAQTVQPIAGRLSLA